MNSESARTDLVSVLALRGKYLQEREASMEKTLGVIRERDLVASMRVAYPDVIGDGETVGVHYYSRANTRVEMHLSQDVMSILLQRVLSTPSVVEVGNIDWGDYFLTVRLATVEGTPQSVICGETVITCIVDKPMQVFGSLTQAAYFASDTCADSAK